MAIVLKTVGVVVKDMAATLAFYGELGLEVPTDAGSEDHVEVPLAHGVILGFLTEARARQADPKFAEPGGQTLNLQFECGSAAEVDAAYSRLTLSGHVGYQAPWDAFWGQRFARVTDPDGRIANLYAELG